MGGAFERRYLSLAGGADLGVAIDGAFTRFATAGSPVIAPGQGMAYSAVTDAVADRLRPAADGRLAARGACARSSRREAASRIGYFSTPEVELRPGTASSTQPMARVIAGVDIAFSPTTALTIRASYTHMFSDPTFTTDVAGSFSLFGSLLDVGVGMAARF